MALDAEDILELQQEAAKNNDSTVDTQKGPLLDWVYDPTAQAASEVALGTDRLRRLYSANFASTADDDEALAFSENHGVGRDIGTAATGFQTFYSFTKPVAGETRTVPPGTVVRRPSDGKGFRVTSHLLEMSGDNAEAFFNATEGWYELTVPVEALSVGPEFDTPAGMVTEADSTLIGFDGTVNKTDIDGGLAAESSEDTVDRTQSALLGNDFGAHGGILRSVLTYNRVIQAVSLAFFTEYSIFQRRSFKPALDVYVIGTKSAKAVETFVAEAGQTEYTLLKPPVMSVSALTKDGGTANFTFTADPSREYNGSYRAVDKITFAAAVGGEVFEVTYLYDEVVRRVQEGLFGSELDANGERTHLFNTDVMVRWSKKVALQATVKLTLQANASEAEATAAAEEIVREYMTGDEYPGLLNPETLRDLLIEGVPGITKVNIEVFRKKLGATLRSGLIELSKVEQGVFEAAADLEIK